MSFMISLKKIIDSEFSFFKALPALLWQILFLWIPLLFIFIISFLNYNEISINYVSLESYVQVFNLTHFRIILRSLLLAFCNSFICLFLAYPMAYTIAFKIHRFKNIALFLLTLPFWINFLVHIYSWFFILECHGLINNLLEYFKVINEPLRLINSWFAIMIVMVYAYLPFLILPVYTALEKLDYRLLEASMDLGASHLKTFFKIILPITFKGARLGFFLVFVMSFGEFVIPTLMGGGKEMFVGTLIWQYFLTDQNMSLGSAFTTLTGAFLILALFLINKLTKLIFTYQKDI